MESEDMNMFTFLDLLVVVFMVVAASGLLAVSLMFLMKKPAVRRVCFGQKVFRSRWKIWALSFVGSKPVRPPVSTYALSILTKWSLSRAMIPSSRSRS